MLKFIKHHMSTIDGIEIYPIISLVLFTAFFTYLIWWVMRTKKEYIQELEQYPLSDDENH